MPGLAAAVFLASASLAFAAPPAPRVHVASVNELTVPQAPFDTTADADKALDAALARARSEHKRVLVDLGGNWCPDCRIFSAVMALPEVAAFLDAHYVVVKVDVGRFNRNLDVPQRFGVPKLVGVPSVLILTPDGTLLDAGHVAALADARSMTPQAIADWLASWAG